MKNKTKNKKMDWKRLAVKTVENGMKKAGEMTVLTFALGVPVETILFTVPAVMVGSAAAKMFLVGVLKY